MHRTVVLVEHPDAGGVVRADTEGHGLHLVDQRAFIRAACDGIRIAVPGEQRPSEGVVRGRVRHAEEAEQRRRKIVVTGEPGVTTRGHPRQVKNGRSSVRAARNASKRSVICRSLSRARGPGRSSAIASCTSTKTVRRKFETASESEESTSNRYPRSLRAVKRTGPRRSAAKLGSAAA